MKKKKNSSPYSWSKWLVTGGIIIFIFFIIFALVEEYTYPSDGILLFISDNGQNILLYMLLVTAIGASASVVFSLIKQVGSMIKTIQSDSAEMSKLAKRRTTVMMLNFLFVLSIILSVIEIFSEDDTLYIMLIRTLSYFNMYIEYYTYLFIFFITSTVLIFVLWFIIRIINNQYSVDFKEQIVKKGFESLFDNVEYHPSGSLEESDVRASGLYNSYNLFDGNDYLSAEYNGKHFVQSDIRLREERIEKIDGKDKKTYNTIFKGLFMIFDYDAISNEPVMVYGKDSAYSVSRGGEIKTELDAFNSKFIVNANNATEAFRILTPPVLEGIVTAKEKLKLPLSMSFANDKLYVAISNGNSFEANSYGNDTFTEQLDRLRGEVQTVLDIIQILYLKK